MSSVGSWKRPLSAKQYVKSNFARDWYKQERVQYLSHNSDLKTAPKLLSRDSVLFFLINQDKIKYLILGFIKRFLIMRSIPSTQRNYSTYIIQNIRFFLLVKNSIIQKKEWLFQAKALPSRKTELYFPWVNQKSPDWLVHNFSLGRGWICQYIKYEILVESNWTVPSKAYFFPSWNN